MKERKKKLFCNFIKYACSCACIPSENYTCIMLFLPCTRATLFRRGREQKRSQSELVLIFDYSFFSGFCLPYKIYIQGSQKQALLLWVMAYYILCGLTGKLYIYKEMFLFSVFIVERFYVFFDHPIRNVVLFIKVPIINISFRSST